MMSLHACVPLFAVLPLEALHHGTAGWFPQLNPSAKLTHDYNVFVASSNKTLGPIPFVPYLINWRVEGCRDTPSPFWVPLLGLRLKTLSENGSFRHCRSCKRQLVERLCLCCIIL